MKIYFKILDDRYIMKTYLESNSADRWQTENISSYHAAVYKVTYDNIIII